MSYKRFDPEDLVISADSITGTVWYNNNPTLSTFITSSVQVASSTGDYYFEIYQTNSLDSTAAVQFDIAYGDETGSGSAFYNTLVTGSSPSRVIYGQYRNLVLGDENAAFIFGDQTGSYFYALSIERSGYKEKLFPGTFNLILSGSGAGNIQLTDNSVDTPSLVFNDAGRVYQIVSGANGTAFTGNSPGGDPMTNGYTPGSGSYGLFLPDIGTIILNGAALSSSYNDGGISMMTSRSNDNAFDVDCSNPRFLFTAISGGASFALNSQETITSDYIFTRARNSEFNYSENPSYISGSSGELLISNFVESPQTYITAIGLYNDANELLAVAKLSRPLLKDFTKELLVRVKLDF